MNDFEAGTLAVDVAIVGAGPAGLAAGYLLTRAGKSVVIVEKDADCAEAVGEGGFFAQSRAVADLWKEILPGGFVQRPPSERIYHEGRYYSYPPRALEAPGKLGLLRSAAWLLGFLRSRLRPIREARSFEDWSVGCFGRALHEDFVRPYAEKIWGLPCDQLSPDWAAQRIERPSLRRAVLGGPGRGSASETRLPRMMWDAARERIAARGGTVLAGHALDQLASDGRGGWRLTASGPDVKVALAARHAISSVPLRELAARLHPLPQATWNASQLKYRDAITVALAVRCASGVRATTIYVNDRRIEACRVRSFGGGSPATADDAGAAGLALDYFCFAGDALWAMDDGALAALATRELGLLGLAAPGEVTGATVVRREKAYPLCDRHYAANLAALRDELAANHPTLHLVGRHGRHRCLDLERAVTSAIVAAETVLADARRPEPARKGTRGDRTTPASDGPRKPTPAREIADPRRHPEEAGGSRFRVAG